MSSFCLSFTSGNSFIHGFFIPQGISHILFYKSNTKSESYPDLFFLILSLSSKKFSRKSFPKTVSPQKIISFNFPPLTCFHRGFLLFLICIHRLNGKSCPKTSPESFYVWKSIVDSFFPFSSILRKSHCFRWNIYMTRRIFVVLLMFLLWKILSWFEGLRPDLPKDRHQINPRLPLSISYFSYPSKMYVRTIVHR